MTEEEAMLYQAVLMVSDIYLSEADKVRIAHELGDEALQGLLTLYDDTVGCEVDWSSGSMETGLDALGKVLSEKYPWLPDEAKHRITRWFMMCWK